MTQAIADWQRKAQTQPGRDDVVAAMLLACGEAARNTDTGMSMIVPGGRYAVAG